MKHPKPYISVKVFHPFDAEQLENAMQILKSRLQKNGIFKELKERKDFQKPSETKREEKRLSKIRVAKRAKKPPRRMMK